VAKGNHARMLWIVVVTLGSLAGAALSLAYALARS
jgi:hypothetical protein